MIGLLARGLQRSSRAYLGSRPRRRPSHPERLREDRCVHPRGATVFAMEHGLIISGELPIGAAATLLASSAPFRQGERARRERCDSDVRNRDSDGTIPRGREVLWGLRPPAPRKLRRARLPSLSSPRPRSRLRRSRAARPRHGAPGSWASLVSPLDGFRSIVLDRPGWGLSTSVDFLSLNYGRCVGDLLRATLDALDVARAHVVGARSATSGRSGSRRRILSASAGSCCSAQALSYPTPACRGSSG